MTSESKSCSSYSVGTQVQSTQSTNSTVATNTVANTVAANSEAGKAAVVLDEQAALKQKQQYQAETETMGLLWMRTSAEYRALAYQGVQCGAKSC